MYPKEFLKEENKIAKASIRNAKVSLKRATIVCREVRRKRFVLKAKKFLEDLLEKKANIRGKYYTNATKEILNLLNSAIKNAENKNLNIEKLKIEYLAPSKGTTFYRSRRKSGFGSRGKLTHLSVILKEV